MSALRDLEGNPAQRAASSLVGRKVVFVFPSFALGGAERQGLLLARFLRETCGAQVSVLGLLDGPATVGEICGSLGIPSRIAPFRIWTRRGQLLFQLLRFALLFRREQSEVLLPYTHVPNLVCGSVWRWAGARACVWQQRDAGVERGPRLLEKLAVRQTPGFIANSTPGIEFLTGQMTAPRDRIRRVPNGVVLESPAEDRETWRSRLDLAPDCLAATMVANLQSFKDHETLLRAWRLVLDRWAAPAPKPILLLAGSFGDTHHPLKALAYDLELGRAVRFLGQVRNVPGLLAASDLCVFSSRLEGCPNGILEAMASGLPVVATDIPGIRDAVGESGLPWLVPPGQPTHLANQILTLATRPDIRAAQGSLNQARVRTEFSPERMQRQTLSAILDWMVR